MFPNARSSFSVYRKSEKPQAFRTVSSPAVTQALVRGTSAKALKVFVPTAPNQIEAEYAQHPAPVLPDENGRAPQTTAILPRPGSDAEYYDREITARTAAGTPIADLHIVEALDAVLLDDRSFAATAEAAMRSLDRAGVDRILREFDVRKAFTNHLYTFLVEDCGVAQGAANGAIVAAAAKAEIERSAGRPAAVVPGLAKAVSPEIFAYAMDRTKAELPSELAKLVRASPYLLLRFDPRQSDLVARAALVKLRRFEAMGIRGSAGTASSVSRRAMDALTPTASAQKNSDPDAGMLAALRYAALRYAAQKSAKPRHASGPHAIAA